MKFRILPSGRLLVGKREFYEDYNGAFEVLASSVRRARLSSMVEGQTLVLCDPIIGGNDFVRRSPYCTFERAENGEFSSRVESSLIPPQEASPKGAKEFFAHSLRNARRVLKQLGSIVSDVEESEYDDIAYISYTLSLHDQPILDAEAYVAAIEDRICNESPLHKLFVCHASEDKPFVDRLVAGLDRRALHAWYDKREIVVGDSIVEKVNSALATVRFVVFVMSPRSVTKPWVTRELSSSLMRQLGGNSIAVLPLMVEDCEVPPLLADLKYADFRRSFRRGLDELVHAIRARTNDEDSA